MKSATRRSRVLAGFALVAASAAVVSAAMFGAASLPASPTASLSAGTFGSFAQSQVMRTVEHPPVRLAATVLGKRAARSAAAGTEPLAGSGRSAGAATVATSSATGRGVLGEWWLDFAGACSRTRGQPRTDALS